MIACPPIATLNRGSYYIVNMIHAIDIWGVHVAQVGCFEECGNRGDIRVIRKVCPEEETEGKFHQNWKF
jgi:hypothetical protein